MSLSALATFAVVQVVPAPLHGLWAVLTSVVVMQASAGGSIRASVEYVLGTFVGAVYATLVSLAAPHAIPLAMGAALTLAIAPLGFAAARSSAFRVAPFTAVIVLLLGSEVGQSPLMAATARLGEVALGGGVAVAVSFLVLPERAHDRGRLAAAAALERLGDALPLLLAGLAEPPDPTRVRAVHAALGAAVAGFDAAVADVKHEQALGFAAGMDPGPLSRTLLRLRHDLVIVGRSAAQPLPDVIARRLAPLADTYGRSVGGYLAASASALRARQPPPAAARIDAALEAYGAEVAAVREEGLTRALSTGELAKIFTLGFAFEQIGRNLADLERCVGEWAAA
jgi:uncharacterized membrane protein YccC